MTIQECYEELGGSYSQVLNRLPSDALIEKFITKFLSDNSFSLLDDAIGRQNWEEAFQAAHSLKGISGNLAFDRLYDSVSTLTDSIRKKPAVDVEAVSREMRWVERDYASTVRAIYRYLDK